MFIYLCMTITLFFPDWDSDTNPDAYRHLARDVQQYDTMTDCMEAKQSIEDVDGLYKKYYPYEDSYVMALTLECVREKKEMMSKAPERQM